MPSLFEYATTSEYQKSGTEAMADFVQTTVLPIVSELEKYEWALIPGKFVVTGEKPLVVWTHIEIGSFVSEFFELWKHRIHAVIFVSHWQRKTYIEKFGLDPSRCFVIRNSIEPIPKVDKPSTDIVDIVYSSGKDRGLDVLLNSMNLVNNQDIRVHVFGQLQGTTSKDPRVILHEKVPNQRVRQQLQQAHIFAYPCTFEETSCISLIEAMSAGCYCVHSDISVLPETSVGTTHIYGYDKNPIMHAQIFARELKKAIAVVRAGWDPSPQVSTANAVYSRERAIGDWINLEKELERLRSGS